MCGQKKERKYPNKEITISILPALEYGLDKNEFIKILQEKIYSELDNNQLTFHWHNNINTVKITWDL